MPTSQTIASSSDWTTIKEALGYASMSRSKMYSLLRDKAIRTVCIKRRGKTKGKRYVSKSSLDTLFDTMCESQCNS